MNRPTLLWMLLALAAGPIAALGQTPAEDFQQNCAMCHTIGGGPLAGPDLAGMSERRERSWLVRFIVDPQAVIDSGDPVARQMVDEYKGMVMPALPGMTPDRVAAMIDHVAEQSGDAAAEAPQSQEVEEPQAAFTEADVEAGLRLFRGDVALEKEGAACLACHDLAGLSWLGGGALGPELTGVHGRLGGRQGLTAWLSAPPTPTMSSLYRTRPLTEDEVRAFTAFFADRAAQEASAGSSNRTLFASLGLAGTALLLLLFDRLWRKRFRGVRRPLVQSSRMRGVQ